MSEQEKERKVGLCVFSSRKECIVINVMSPAVENSLSHATLVQYRAFIRKLVICFTPPELVEVW